MADLLDVAVGACWMQAAAWCCLAPLSNPPLLFKACLADTAEQLSSLKSSNPHS